jgi:hypothetical protein
MLVKPVLRLLPMVPTMAMIARSDACCDQAVFDGRRARLILIESSQQFTHVTALTCYFW